MDRGTAPQMRTGYELLSHWIRPERIYPGDPNACITGTGISVWAIVGHWSYGECNAEATARAYGIEVEAVQAAIQYYRLHRDLIDARLAANDASPD